MNVGNDILIRLYGIKDYSEAFRNLRAKGIEIKKNYSTVEIEDSLGAYEDLIDPGIVG